MEVQHGYITTTPKSGRNPLPASQRRSMTFRLRLNRREWNVFADTAEKTGQSMAELVRGAVIEKAKRVDAVAARLAERA